MGVNDDGMFIFGRTIPLTVTHKHTHTHTRTHTVTPVTRVSEYTLVKLAAPDP